MTRAMAESRILQGRTIASQIESGLRGEIVRLPAAPQLRVLYFDSPASRVYWHAQQAAAVRLGIRTGAPGNDWKTGSVELPWDTPWTQVERILQAWNADNSVHGIFVHQPMPPQIDPQQVSAVIDPRKDVEGIHPENSARRFFARARIGSCTALAVMELIESTGIALEGKEAVVVGHSDIVGRPVSMLLLDKLATTTVCHVGTDRAGQLEAHVRRADVLVVAAGRPHLIKGEWVKQGSIVIDVGINVKDGHVVGDVEFESAKKRAAAITPVPGGVGPVTVMMVMKNTVEAFKQQTGRA